MPKSFLVCIVFFLTGMLYSQSGIVNPILNDYQGSDSISYGISGILELNHSMKIQLESVQLNPDKLCTVYTLNMEFDQNPHPINNNLQYNPITSECAIQSGVFNTSVLMIRLLDFRNDLQNVL